MARARSSVLILASGSPRRLALLDQIGIVPDHISPADVDETPEAKERPGVYATRLAREKAEVAADRAKSMLSKRDTFVLRPTPSSPWGGGSCPRPSSTMSLKRV